MFWNLLGTFQVPIKDVWKTKQNWVDKTCSHSSRFIVQEHYSKEGDDGGDVYTWGCWSKMKTPKRHSRKSEIIFGLGD